MGESALTAIKMICERADYKFYFKYDGTPVFKPAADGAVVFAFTEEKHIASARNYQDYSEIWNRIIIEGKKQADPVNLEETLSSELRGEAADDEEGGSIDTYGERTKTIKNHLFQDQTDLDAMCASLLAKYKDPKWYADVEVPFNLVPLELGDKITWVERLSPTARITQAGIIRDIKISTFNTIYKCEIVPPIFYDDFEDGIRAPEWTDVENNGTIVEADGVLRLAIADGVHGDFWGGLTDAPVCTVDILDTTKCLEIITKINSYEVTNKTRVGLYITDSVDGTHGIFFARGRNDTTPTNGLGINDMNVGELAYVDETTLPIWLRIRTSGSQGAGSILYFDYSTDGYTWTNLHVQEDESWSKAGLLVKNWADDWSAVSAPFEFFRICELICPR